MNRPSSERLEMPSLAYALESLFFTVPAEMPMCRAISALLHPRHASIETANSVVERLSATLSPASGLLILREHYLKRYVISITREKSSG